MNLSVFASSGLAAQGGGFQPQRKDNFAVVVSGVEGVENLTLATAGVEVPGLSIAQGKIKHFNETVFYAASRSPTQGGKITYNDFVDVDTLKILAKWFKTVFCPENGAIGWAKDYKKSGSIYLLPPGISSQDCPGSVDLSASRRTFKLKGVWPMELNYDSLSMGDDGTSPAQISLTLSIDQCIPEAME